MRNPRTFFPAVRSESGFPYRALIMAQNSLFQIKTLSYVGTCTCTLFVWPTVPSIIIGYLYTCTCTSRYMFLVDLRYMTCMYVPTAPVVYIVGLHVPLEVQGRYSVARRPAPCGGLLSRSLAGRRGVETHSPLILFAPAERR